jgi:hypothetical protein
VRGATNVALSVVGHAYFRVSTLFYLVIRVGAHLLSDFGVVGLLHLLHAHGTHAPIETVKEWPNLVQHSGSGMLAQASELEIRKESKI